MNTYQEEDTIENMQTRTGFGGFVKNTWTMALTYILLGFSLAAALAWVDLVRNLISTYVKVKSDASLAYFVFAICITIVAVIVYMIIKGYLAPGIRDAPIVGVIG
jgi:uncharacterized membrane protein YdbT with pleckstrin-like domain